MYFKHIAWGHFKLTNVPQIFDIAIQTPHTVDTWRTGLTACCTKGRKDAAIGQNTGRHGL
jgi:hypothetical protein